LTKDWIPDSKEFRHVKPYIRAQLVLSWVVASVWRTMARQNQTKKQMARTSFKFETSIFKLTISNSISERFLHHSPQANDEQRLQQQHQHCANSLLADVLQAPLINQPILQAAALLCCIDLN
jgi:hypothetical protein